MHRPERTGRRTFLTGIGAVLLSAPGAVRARAAAPGSTPGGREEWLRRLESHLDSLTTMKAAFLQVSSTGEVARGTFYMRRPGKLRIEYAPPSPVLIVADGHRLIYYDKELETANMVPIEDTLAAFLVRDDVRFAGDVKVTGFSHEGGLLRVVLARTREPEGGSLALVFDDDPLRLRQWIVTDAQGISTRVSLTDVAFGIALADGLFEVAEPDTP
jgi:outer membrane lipoprotein-sorting protein